MAGRATVSAAGQVVALEDGLRHVVWWATARMFKVLCQGGYPPLDNMEARLIGGVPTCLWCMAR